MHGTLCFTVLLLTTTLASAQTAHKKACDFLKTSEVEAALRQSNLTTEERTISNGTMCLFQRPAGAAKETVLRVIATYSDTPDRDAVLKFLKGVETQTYNHAQPLSGIGDAAYYLQPFDKELTVFAAGILKLDIGPGTPEQLKSLAEHALNGSGLTGFTYTGAVPETSKPASQPQNAVTSGSTGSSLDQLKAALTQKAESNDVRAAEALADLYRYPPTDKPDYPAAMYWYKRASDHGSARAAFDLGTMYNDGIGTRANQDAAKALFTKAADTGYVPAMMPLAFIYAASPDFVSKRRASEYALKAAEGNDPEGHLTAGYLWDKGQLSFDDSESGRNALAEYRKAADQQNCIAMMNIGGLYFAGRHQIKQDGVQAEQWFGRAESCFGNAFRDMQQQAAQYRSFAAAHHLPVPEAPPAATAGSRYFRRPGSAAASSNDQQLFKMVGDMLEMGALSAAYLIAHPEVAKQVPALPGNYKSAADYGDDMQKKIHYEQNLQKLYTSQCRPPVGCY